MLTQSQRQFASIIENNQETVHGYVMHTCYIVRGGTVVV